MDTHIQKRVIYSAPPPWLISIFKYPYNSIKFQCYKSFKCIKLLLHLKLIYLLWRTLILQYFDILNFFFISIYKSIPWTSTLLACNQFYISFSSKCWAFSFTSISITFLPTLLRLTTFNYFFISMFSFLTSLSSYPM